MGNIERVPILVLGFLLSRRVGCYLRSGYLACCLLSRRLSDRRGARSRGRCAQFGGHKSELLFLLTVTIHHLVTRVERAWKL